MPRFIVRGRHRGGKMHELVIRAPNKAAARKAGADILYGSENVKSVTHAKPKPGDKR